MDIRIKVTSRSVLIAALLGGGFWLATQLRPVLLLLCAALFLALGLAPVVAALSKRRLPRGVAAFLSTLLLGFLFIGSGAIGISSLLDQVQRLAQSLPQLLDSLSHSPYAPEFLQSFNQTLVEQLSTLSGSILKATWGAFSGALTVTSILLFTFYILLDLQEHKRRLLSLLPKADRRVAKDIVAEVEERLGGWLRAQFVLMLCVGGLTFVGLALLRVEYAVALSVIAGLLEIVPTVGPIVATIPAAIVGFYISPAMGLAVIALFIIVQQLENNLLVPRVMGRALGFSPLATMIIILVGGKLFGLFGVLISIPLTLVVSILAKHLLRN